MWPIPVIASPPPSLLCLQINLDMSQRLSTQGSKSVPSKFGISTSGSSQSQSSNTLTAQAHGYRTKKDSLQPPSQAQQEDPKQAPQLRLPRFTSETAVRISYTRCVQSLRVLNLEHSQLDRAQVNRALKATFAKLGRGRHSGHWGKLMWEGSQYWKAEEKAMAEEAANNAGAAGGKADGKS